MRWIRRARGNRSRSLKSQILWPCRLSPCGTAAKRRFTELESLLAEYFFELTLKRLHVFGAGTILRIVAWDEA